MLGAGPMFARSFASTEAGDFLTKHEIFMVRRQLSFSECPTPGWHSQRPVYRESRFEDHLLSRLLPALRTKLDVKIKLPLKTGGLKWEPADSPEPFRLEIGLSPQAGALDGF